jgi:hypothetical protein
VQARPSELGGAVDTLTQLTEGEVDELLNRFITSCNAAFATSSLSLRRKFALTERGLRRIVGHADKTRRELKRAADRIRRERAR